MIISSLALSHNAHKLVSIISMVLVSAKIAHCILQTLSTTWRNVLLLLFVAVFVPKQTSQQEPS